VKVVAIRRGFLETAEGQLHYRRCGRGDAFVLLMTLPLNTTMFLPLMRVLGETHDCIAVDLMGYGDSDRRQRPWTCRDHAEALLEGLAGLGVDRLHLLGGHFTGQVAIEAALLAPDRIRTLFIDGAVGWSIEEGRELARNWTLPPWYVSGSYLAEHWDYVQALFRRLDPEFELRAGNMDVIAELGLAYVTAPLGGPEGQSMFDYDLLARARLLEKTPTILIGSPTDTLWSQHAKVLAAIPRARDYLFETINPLYQFDRPERAVEYASMLRSFLHCAKP
jgi:pimeloyl-ACP methyl ester carboxylesterase